VAVVIAIVVLCFATAPKDNSFVVSLWRVQVSNLTLINFTLYVFGPMREDELTMVRATSETLQQV